MSVVVILQVTGVAIHPISSSSPSTDGVIMGQMQENYGRLRNKAQNENCQELFENHHLNSQLPEAKNPFTVGCPDLSFLLKITAKENFPDHGCDHLSVAGGG